MRSLSNNCKYPLEKVEDIVYSKQNYKKMIEIVQKIIESEKGQNFYNNCVMDGGLLKKIEY